MKRRSINLDALVLAIALLGLTSVPAVACTPTPLTEAQRADADDRELLEATVFFRGVIENLQPDGYGGMTMNIRWTRTLWGNGAPAHLPIQQGYFSQCARGNLGAVLWPGGYDPDWPGLSDGMGVTVIGKPPADPSDFTILVDGAPDTQRIVKRFQKLRFGW